MTSSGQPPLSSSTRPFTQFTGFHVAVARRDLLPGWGRLFMLGGGALQSGERSLQGLGFDAVLGTQDVQGGVGALAFDGKFVAVLAAQGGEFLAVFDAGLA